MKNSQSGFVLPLIIIIAVLVIGGGIYFYKTSSKSGTLITIKDDRYFNMEFQSPDGYIKKTSLFGVYRVESMDSHSSPYAGGTVMDQGARIDLHNQEPVSGRIFLSQEEWVKQKLSSAFANETAKESTIDGMPVVIKEWYPTESEPPYNYNKSVYFLNQKEKNEVVLELQAFSKTKDGFESYKNVFDKMLSTIKLKR